MDPNAAFDSILHGHMVADHVEALTEWLASGGFRPRELIMPVDCHPYFSDHVLRLHGQWLRVPKPPLVYAKADRYGVWTQVQDGDDWWCAGTWAQIAALDDSG
jgi:hypothetical protein